MVSAYTPEQQTTLDGMNLSFKLGIAYEKASQGQNVTEFNTLADIYNAWIRQHFGLDAKLFKPKINESASKVVSSETNNTTPLTVSPETKNNRSLPVSVNHNLVSGGMLNGTYKDNVTLPQYSESGKWHITSFLLIDNVGNRQKLNETQIKRLGFPTIIEVKS